MTMHILFMTDNFPPESNAPANRTYEHALSWITQGHKVTVITTAPNFPQGRVFAGYRNTWYGVEHMDGIKVVRVKTFIAANEGFLPRIIDYCTFMVSGCVAAVLQNKPDVIVATSPQFFCAIGGWVASALRRRPFVLEIRDMWPSSIVAVGAMKDSVFIRLMGRLELFLYQRASRIVVVTRSFKREMIERGVDGSKIEVVLNGVDRSVFYPRTKNAELSAQYGLKRKFVVGYIGTHGLAHDLVNVLKGVELLKTNADIQFIFVGAGAERARVEQLVKDRSLTNVTLVPQQAREMVPDFISLCDICLVPLKNSPVFADVIPSKIFECQAMGVPVLMMMPRGEATQIVEESSCGVVINPESPAEMAKMVQELQSDSSKVASLSDNAKKIAVTFSREKQAMLMLGTLEGVAFL